MRIFHLETGKSMFGGAYQVAGLIRHLPSDFENHLGFAAGAAIGKVVGNGAVLHSLPFAGGVDPRSYFAVRRTLRGLRPDIVHIHSRRGADVWGVLAARHLGLTHLVSRRVDSPEARWLAQWRYRDCARVVGISAKICEVLRRSGVAADKIRLIRSGVDTALYRPRPRSGKLNQLFGIPADFLTVGMVAQFIPRKGHSDLVAAARSILKVIPNTRFLLFGKGQLRAEIEQQVDAAGLRPAFIFPGFREDLPDLLPEIDVVAHPAHAEGLGVALLQASACGVPVVAGRAGGIPEIVIDGESGFLVPPGQPAELAEKLVDLLVSAEKRQAMGDAGRCFVEAECSLETMAAQNAALYHEIGGHS